jgi:hypothetical protein
MIEKFIVFYLVWYWVMCILYKNNYLPNKLETLGNKIGYKNLIGWFLIEVSECKFCMDFWTATLLGVVNFAYFNNYYYLFVGVFCSSISAHFRK